MRLLYRFLSNFLCTCMLVSSAVLVCCMDMQDRVWLSVSDNLHARAVPWMCGASRDAHAFASAGARRPSGFIAKAACTCLKRHLVFTGLQLRRPLLTIDTQEGGGVGASPV